MRIKNQVLWEPSVMNPRQGYKWPWSTWVGVKREVEAKVPHNMALLMAHAYVKPVVSTWVVKKLDADPFESMGPRDYLNRRYVPKNYKVKNTKYREKQRFTLPRFRNIAAKVDDKWDQCPLDLPTSPSASQRENGQTSKKLDKAVGESDIKNEDEELLGGLGFFLQDALDVLIDMNSDADISVDIFIEPPNPAELSDDDPGNEENEIQELSGICHVIDC
ncbi:hypothetical protein GE061_006410 [Apolygus lucorum]|uniref:Uncharacterized protein n=1 Tax=Apolygus lucorum TaxID=248454 RepID=A0A8S9WV68_APOLU|nr:hypothetical protein GE061_006410 [Apolygus lucorum]